VAELPQPAAVGRVRGLDLRHGLAALLVHRHDPRPRDPARPRPDQDPRASFYGLFASAGAAATRHWHHYEKAYLLLAGLATPLVLSVHSVVSFDFAVSIIPGWHTTIFPPYFVAGAIFSGFAMVLTLMLPLRRLRPRGLITQYHLDNMNKIILATGRWSATPTRWSSSSPGTAANPYEQFAFVNRAFGPYAWAYWIMVSCNVISPQLFWFKRIRTNPASVDRGYIFVNIGMWFERFVIT
jgi:hypothetical protein